MNYYDCGLKIDFDNEGLEKRNLFVLKYFMSSKKEMVRMWMDGARRNANVASDSFKMKHYDWCLFFWHLVLEKTIKARIVQQSREVPWVHNLIVLCEKAKINLIEEEKKKLAEINTFNVEARYETIRYALYKKATKEYAIKWVKICKKFYKKFGEL